jgi:hypothetical protein
MKVFRALALVVVAVSISGPLSATIVCDAYYMGGACCKCSNLPSGQGQVCAPCFGPTGCKVACESTDGVCADNGVGCYPAFCDPETETCGM